MYELGMIIILTLFAIAGVVYLYVLSHKETGWRSNPDWKPLTGTEQIANRIHTTVSRQQEIRASKPEEYPTYGEDTELDEITTLEDLPPKEARWKDGGGWGS